MRKSFLFTILLLSLSCTGCFGMYLTRYIQGSPSQQLLMAIKNKTYSSLTVRKKATMLLAAIQQIDIEQTGPYQEEYLQRLLTILKATKNVDLGIPIIEGEIKKVNTFITNLQTIKEIYEQKIKQSEKNKNPITPKAFESKYTKALQELKTISKSYYGTTERKEIKIKAITEETIQHALLVKNATAIAELLKITRDENINLKPDIYIKAQETRTLIEKNLAEKEKKLKKQFEKLEKQKAACNTIKTICSPDQLTKSFDLTYLKDEEEEGDSDDGDKGD